MRITIASIAVFWFLSQGISRAQTSQKNMITLPAEVVVDKIRGGMFGMMIGNMDGMLYEFKFYDKHGDVETYVPSLPNGAETDDDTDFEWVYIYNMQKMRTAYIPYEDLSNYWKSSINRGTWNANRYARYLMDLDIKPPLTGTLALNPWAEFNVAGQFVCEAFGLVAPAMPQTAAKIGLHYTKISIGFEPAQTTQLFTTMISTAFIESDVNKILDAGVASLDPKSIMVQIIADVRKWHALNPQNPAETHRLIHEKYVREDEILRNRNGTELNTAVIVAAFLYGNGDFAETIRHGMNFGYDADCNTTTLGTIVGVMYGHRRMMNEGWQIVDRYRNTKRDNMPMDETIISFSDRIIDVFEMVNKDNGGSKSVVNNVVVYNIPGEKPASVEKLLSIEEEIVRLKDELGNSIITDLLSGDKQATARAAYFAVALDMAGDLKKKYPKQWKEACYNLSGYWKVISNIFHTNNFELMKQFRAKFAATGFGRLNFEQNEKVLYSEKEIWKDPKSIY
jgi:hypothetical protein